jgi:FeS assembly SUF system regulator
MIKISRMADYAVVVLSAFTDVEQGTERLLSATYVSETTRLPEPTVAKILKLLARGDVLKSVRGATGGYALSKTAAEITVADIINAVEGPIALTACVEGATHSCDYADGCPINGRWDDVNFAISKALENVSLKDMVTPKNNITALKEGTQ